MAFVLPCTLSFALNINQTFVFISNAFSRFFFQSLILDHSTPFCSGKLVGLFLSSPARKLLIFLPNILVFKWQLLNPDKNSLLWSKVQVCFWSNFTVVFAQNSFFSYRFQQTRFLRPEIPAQTGCRADRDRVQHQNQPPSDQSHSHRVYRHLFPFGHAPPDPTPTGHGTSLHPAQGTEPSPSAAARSGPGTSAARRRGRIRRRRRHYGRRFALFGECGAASEAENHKNPTNLCGFDRAGRWGTLATRESDGAAAAPV